MAKTAAGGSRRNAPTRIHDATEVIRLNLRGGRQVGIPAWLGAHICKRLHIVVLTAIAERPLGKVFVINSALNKLTMDQRSLSQGRQLRRTRPWFRPGPGEIALIRALLD